MVWEEGEGYCEELLISVIFVKAVRLLTNYILVNDPSV